MKIFFSLVVLFSSWAIAKPSVIFVVEGVDGKNSKVIQDIINKHLTENYNLDQLQEVLGLIYKTGKYGDAEVDIEEHGDRTEVIFRISPLRVVRTIQFKGNTSFSSSDLMGQLGFTEGEGYAADKVKAGVENIKRHYNLNGYLNAQVIGEFTLSNLSDLNLEIDVDEGSPCTIKDIRFESVNPNLNKNLTNIFKKRRGKIFTQNALSNLQNDLSEELFSQRYYASGLQPPEISYDPLKTGVTLTYVINDPYAYALVFEGNQTFTETKIRNELKLDPNNRLTTSPMEDLADRLTRFYKSQGYANVNVLFKEKIFPKDYIRRVSFLITEGVKVKIKDIHIEGSFSKPEKFYSHLLLDQNGSAISGHIYDGDVFEKSTKNLVTTLQNQGFISAKVTGLRTDFDKRRESVTMTVVLDEGPQTFIDKVILRGTKSLSQDDIENAIELKANSSLNLKAVEDSVTRIIDLYRSRGYLDARVLNQGKNIIVYSNDNTKATLTYEVSEGPLITVNSIVIEGNTFTKEEVVRRELQFKPGDILTPEKISYSEQRLQRLSFLSSIDIKPLEEDPTQGSRVVLVHVEEQDPGIFKSGIGINNDEGPTGKVFAEVGYRNLWGTGRGINLRVQSDYKTQYNFLETIATVGYTEPFILGTENTGKINYTRAREFYGYASSSTTYPNVQGPFTYGIDNSQVDTVLERDLTRQLKLIFETYGIAQINYFEANNLLPATPLDVAVLGPTFILDRRDDPFNPKRGDLTSLAIEFSNPYLGSTQTVSYYKIVPSYTKYLSFGPFTWANQGKCGYAQNLSPLPDGGIPAIKGFILGGQSSLRAFNAITESVPLYTDFPAPDNIPITPAYTSFILAKSEIRFPIAGSFGGSLFYDGGQVLFYGYNPRFTWRDDLGVGLLYNTPVGPVTLEYAQKLNQDVARGESPGQFLFSIGVF